MADKAKKKTAPSKSTGRRRAPKRPPITVGGVEVAAGTEVAVDLRITDLSTHTPMTMPVRVTHGRRDGPTLFVCAAIHGDEINGVEIIRRLTRLDVCDRVRGTLIVVPIVNVMGFVAQTRYLPDRRDLNRSFPGSTGGSMAARLAGLFIKEIVSKSTHGIDLHTGAIHRDNFPQIRGNLDDPETERMARAFGVPVIINTGFREGSLREAAARSNVPVIVYEAGEALRFSEPCIRGGVQGVVRIMRTVGMLPQRRRAAELRSLMIRSSTWMRAPQSGLLRTTVALGSQVKAGDCLGIIADPLGDKEIQVHTHADGVIIGRINLPVVNEGDALFHVARHEGTQVIARTLDDFEPEAAYEAGLTSEIADDPRIV